ncbi:hypothetical protein [Nocardia sp. NRRL S-836]|uniref:hypothetical protein n=1 Tax=Nocardia sp. NRRL S-836 TaxID=1519492 RepID=UPI0006AEB2E9|nr:hypothetical protein [Nocardia sp. NRRL S-836]
MSELDRLELQDHLIRLVTSRLLDPLEILLPTADLDELHDQVHADAGTWAQQLLTGSDRQARHLVIRLLTVLHPGDTPFDPPDDWWATPLGRVAARRAGHPSRQHVSFAVAGAMLGITRQGVHDLVNRNKLQRHPDGGVTVESIQIRLAQRRDT